MQTPQRGVRKVGVGASHPDEQEQTPTVEAWLLSPRGIRLTAIAVLTIAGVVAGMAWFATRDTWERDHLPRLVELRGQAQQHAARGELDLAAQALTEVLGTGAGRPGKSEALTSLLTETEAELRRVQQQARERTRAEAIRKVVASAKALLETKRYADAVAQLRDAVAQADQAGSTGDAIGAARKEAEAALADAERLMRNEEAIQRTFRLYREANAAREAGDWEAAAAAYDAVLAAAVDITEPTRESSDTVAAGLSERAEARRTLDRQRPFLLRPSNALAACEEVFIPVLRSGAGSVAERIGETPAGHNHFETILFAGPDCGLKSYLREVSDRGKLSWEVAVAGQEHFDVYVLNFGVDEAEVADAFNSSAANFYLARDEKDPRPHLIASVFSVPVAGMPRGLTAYDAQIVFRVALYFDAPRPELVAIAKHLYRGGALRLRWSIREGDPGLLGVSGSGEMLTLVRGEVYDHALLGPDAEAVLAMEREFDRIRTETRREAALLEQQVASGQTPRHTTGLAEKAAAAWARSQAESAAGKRAAEARSPKAIADRWVSTKLPMEVQGIEFVGYFNRQAGAAGQYGRSLADVGLGGVGPGSEVAVVYQVVYPTGSGFLRTGRLMVALVADQRGEWRYREVYLDGRELWTY